MKNKQKNIFWVFFLVWILVSGTLFGTLHCRGQQDRQAGPDCRRQLLWNSAAVRLCSDWDHFSRSQLLLPGSDNTGIACRDPLCRPSGTIINGPGNTFFPNSGMSRPKYLDGPFTDGNHRSNPFFASHEIKQPVAIYTIVQSFLC